MKAKLLIYFGRKMFKLIKQRRDFKRLEEYVNNENELDVQMKQAFKKINKFGKDKEQMEQTIAILENKIKNFNKKGDAK